MNRLPALFIFLLSALIFGAAQSSGNYGAGSQPASGIDTKPAYANAQKAEPNPQNPATPQANTGQASPTSPVGAGAENGNATPTTFATPTAADNATLQGRIQQALNSEPSLAGSRVSVNVTDTALELSGTVASSKDRLTAQRIAQSFDNNRKFDDKLAVTGQAPAARNAQQK